LKDKAEKHKERLAAVIITYPSIFSVFECGVAEAFQVVHQHGGKVFMDGADMNAHKSV
jgi:glycine dehydrogenase